MSRILIIPVILLLSSHAWAQKKQWKDGQWNGNPWEKSHLLAEVKKGNSDALAEWAFCSRNALSQIEYHPALIYSRAEKAHSGGSLLGKRILGRCLFMGEGTKINKQRGLKLIQEAADMGLPDALLDMAGYYMWGEEVKVDAQRAKALLDKVQKYNCFRYNYFMTGYYSLDEQPHSNPEKAAEYHTLAVIKDGNFFACNRIRINYYHHPDRPINRFYSQETIKRAHTIIEHGISLNNAHCLSYQGAYESKYNDVNRGIALMIRAANLGNAHAHRVMAQWMRNGARDRDYNLRAVGSVKGAARAAVIAYELGQRNKTVRYCYAESITLQLNKNVPLDRLNLAESLYIELIAEGYPSAAGQYGQFLARRYTYLDEKKILL